MSHVGKTGSISMSHVGKKGSISMSHVGKKGSISMSHVGKINQFCEKNFLKKSILWVPPKKKVSLFWYFSENQFLESFFKKV